MLLSVTAHEPKAIAYYILAGCIILLFLMLRAEYFRHREYKKNRPSVPNGQTWREFKENLSELSRVILGIAAIFILSFLYFAFFHVCFFSGFDFNPESFIGPSIFLSVLVIAGMVSYEEMTKNIKR